MPSQEKGGKVWLQQRPRQEQAGGGRQVVLVAMLHADGSHRHQRQDVQPYREEAATVKGNGHSQEVRCLPDGRLEKGRSENHVAEA